MISGLKDVLFNTRCLTGKQYFKDLVYVNLQGQLSETKFEVHLSVRTRQVVIHCHLRFQ